MSYFLQKYMSYFSRGHQVCRPYQDLFSKGLEERQMKELENLERKTNQPMQEGTRRMCLSPFFLKSSFPKAPPTHTPIFLCSWSLTRFFPSLSSHLTCTSVIILDLALTVSKSHSNGESARPPWVSTLSPVWVVVWCVIPLGRAHC